MPGMGFQYWSSDWLPTPCLRQEDTLLSKPTGFKYRERHRPAVSLSTWKQPAGTRFQAVPWSVRSSASWASVCYLPGASGGVPRAVGLVPTYVPHSSELGRHRRRWGSGGKGGWRFFSGHTPSLDSFSVFVFSEWREFFFFAAIKKVFAFLLGTVSPFQWGSPFTRGQRRGNPKWFS